MEEREEEGERQIEEEGEEESQEEEWSEEEDEEESEEKSETEEDAESKEEEEEESEAEEEEESEVRCPVTHPAHPHTLSRRFKTSIKSGCFACDHPYVGYFRPSYYHCNTCKVSIHERCLSHLKKIIHPFHLQHPLTFTRLNTKSETNNLIQTQSSSIFDRCGWCGNHPDTWVYSCSICSFCLCLPCSQNIPLLTITNPKSHHHSLFFFPRPLLVPCDACGLVIASEASYTCFQCNYMVHQSCVNLPRVIKLTRHSHRLFHTPYLPPAVSSCGVCYRGIDTRFGVYSCKHEDCSYVVHSKCATHHQVWDGQELEWEPEALEETEDVTSFKNVGDDLIKYFSHEHNLKLEEYDAERDAEKQCEACILPIDFRCFYSCTECDYSLHEICVGLPRKLDHVLHKHRLILDTAPLDDYNSMTCSACSRNSNGFRYKCIENGCMECHIEIQCILIPPLFTHQSHNHPLFTSISYGPQIAVCSTCHERRMFPRLHCTLCDFNMCYRCATIPTEILYKHDEHPLTLCYGESADVGIYWCEICEQTIDVGKWFYTCNKCCVTIHRLCIFGSSNLMKAGSTFDRHGFQVKSIPNNNCTRLICAICEERCIYSVCYTLLDEYDWFGKALCSFWCLHIAMRRISPEDM